MKLSGERDFAAPRSVVWQAINDPAQLSKLIPGVQSFEVTDPSHFTAEVKIPLGLGSLALTLEFEKGEEHEPDFSSLNAHGRGVGAVMSMSTSFRLAEAESGTRMSWEAEVSIAGPVGAMGQRVLQPIFRQQVDRVLGALEAQVAAAAGAADA